MSERKAVKATGHPEYATIAMFQRENAALRAALKKWIAHAEMNPSTFKSRRTGDWVPLVKETREALGDY